MIFRNCTIVIPQVYYSFIHIFIPFFKNIKEMLTIITCSSHWRYAYGKKEEEECKGGEEVPAVNIF